MRDCTKTLLIAFIISLHSCAIMRSNNTVKEQSYEVNYPANYGYVIGAMTSENPEGLEYIRAFHYKSKDNKIVDKVLISNDFAEPKYNDVLFALALPAGDYYIYAFSMTGNEDWLLYTELPFKVYPNKALYMGDIKNIPKKSKSIFNLKKPNGGKFEITNKAERDIPALVIKYPFLGSIETYDGVPSGGYTTPWIDDNNNDSYLSNFDSLGFRIK